jgi:1,2-phenylacetyl-CoA epoxidase catalytic subunit
MALAEWMIPRLSLSAEAHLQYQIKTIKAEGPSHIQDTVELACSLVQQNAINQTLLRQAIQRVAELELTLLLMESRRPSWLDRLKQLVRRHP